MAKYSMKDLKEKMNSSTNIRQLNVKEAGTSKKIWLPMDEVVYHRTHFDIKSRTSFTRSTKSVLDCVNQTPGEKGAGCPICEEIEELWKQWRDTSNKEEKKKIQNRINNIVSEEFWYNCIDIDNPTEFIAVRFTPAMFREIDKIADKYGLRNVTWIYKYSKDSNRYTLIENTDNATKIKELTEVYDDLIERDYEHGGPCDLEKALIRPITRERMLEILGGGNEEDNEHFDDDKPKAQPKSSVKKEDKSKAKIVEEDTSIDDISLEETGTETKVSKAKDKLDEQLTLDDESLGSETIDELGLEDLELDDGPKMLKIDYAIITEKVKAKDVAYLKKIASYLVENQKITKKDAINDQIKELAAYVKKSNEIEIPESVLV